MSGPKPSLFNRPAWAATKKSGPQSSEKSVFGQHRVYDDILAAQRKNQEEREARHKAKAEKLTAEEQRDVEQRSPKRRRVSKRSSPAPSDIESSPTSSTSAQARTPEPSQSARILRSTPRKDIELVKGLEDEHKRRSAPSHPIDISESDDDVRGVNRRNETVMAHVKNTVPSPKRSRKPQHLAVPEDDEDDPFLRELQQKARKKAEQKQKEKESGVSRTGSSSLAGTAQPPVLEQVTGSPTKATPEDKDSHMQTREPNVAIFIRTHIPGTKDLVVNRHSSQVLKQVREYWTQRHNLEPDLARQVFFTWRGTRLYNSSTTQSLINILKRERGIPLASDEDPSNGKIQIDAVTQEILDSRARANAEMAVAAAAAPMQTATEDGEDDEAPKEVPKKEGIVLILKCKDVEDMPLRVRPNTSIGKIMRAFQSQRHIDRAKKCWLVFDGERLEEDMTAQTAGFEDGEQVEVHPR